MRDIERKIARIIAERDFGGWDADSLRRVERARIAWERSTKRRERKVGKDERQAKKGRARP